MTEEVEAAEPRGKLAPAQRAFATSREPFPAFVGGFGSGKTAAAIARAMALKAHFRKNDIAYYLPSYPLVEDIAMRRFPELCERKGWAFKTRGGSSPHIEFPGAGRIVFRSMSNPDAIVGYEVAHSICDELDTLPMDLAERVWNKIIARNRQKCAIANTVGVATTPEGFRFVWDRWVRNPAPGYVLFRARTMDNAAHLPEGYIENLSNSYPPALLAAYLDGQFVNLTSGSVYTEFNRARMHTPEKIRAGETLHIGMDFNVQNMTACINVIRDDVPYLLSELTGVADTPAMAALLVAKYKTQGHAIVVYPDASGNSRKSVNAQESDLTILRAAGFTLRNNPSNPAVRDRINSVQAACKFWRVNTDDCPVSTEAFEKQAYDRNGEPSKDGGLDHPVDAQGYFLTHRWPVVKRVVQVQSLNF